MAADDSSHASFQRLLRAIGAYLDQEQPKHFRLIEEHDSFTVVTEDGDRQPNLTLTRFDIAETAERAEQLVHGRKVSGKAQSRPWPLAGTSREDALRALGFELDDAGAHGIAIDEGQDELLVTYSFLDPGHGYAWRKRMVVLRHADMQEVLQSAYSRKHRKGLLRVLRR
ncbi:MAG: hypothetical protein ACR2JC_00790 [Chloroflexota bacterium]|nr:MAG: hypothetical protein DLM70_07105 [Chloroflexota bacterium]